MPDPGGSVGERLPRRVPYWAHSTWLQAFKIAWQACECPLRGWGVASSWQGNSLREHSRVGCWGVGAEVSFFITGVESEALAS